MPAEQIIVDPDAPCPCGDSRAARSCCAPSGHLRPTRTPLREVAVTVVGQVNGCYARCLGDCGGSISAEHFVSEGLLDDLNGGEPVHVRGPAWRDGKWLPPAVMHAKVLCERHNQSLSPIDARMLRFARAVRRWADEAGRQDPSSWTFAIHGHDVERWMLKALCGIVVGGHAATSSGDAHARVVPDRWVKILFDREPMPASWGLYTSGRIGAPLLQLGPPAVNVAPLSVRGSVVGLQLEVHGFTLTLSLMHTDLELARGAIAPDSMYRPTLLQMMNGATLKRLALGWDAGDRDPPKVVYRAPKLVVAVR